MKETSTASSPKPKPVVWINTPHRRFGLEGKNLKTEEVLAQFDARFSDPLRELIAWPKLPWSIWLTGTGGGGIYQARNVAATEFYTNTTSDDDRLLMVDYDLMPTAQDYVKLLSHDLSIVGGLYTIRAEAGHWVMNTYGNARSTANGVLPVMELGTGFKCFKRSVFRKVMADNPWLNCESDGDHSKRFYSFFSMGPVWDKKMWPGKGRGLTEDYWFDWLCRESGFTTCVDTRIQIRHYDEATKMIYPAIFPPNPATLPLEAKEP